MQVEDFVGVAGIAIVGYIGSLSPVPEATIGWPLMTAFVAIARFPSWLDRLRIHQAVRRLQHLGRKDQLAVVARIFDSREHRRWLELLRKDLPQERGIGHEVFVHSAGLIRWTRGVFAGAVLCSAITTALLMRSGDTSTQTKLWLGILVASSTVVLFLAYWRNHAAEQRIEISPGEIRAYVGDDERSRLPWNTVKQLRIRPWLRRVEIAAVDGKRIVFLFDLVGFQRALNLSLVYGPFGLGMVAT
jgi:hypothetical protein